VHYDKYSSEYDNMQEMTGFNDPVELIKVVKRELLEAGKITQESRVVDFGCGTGLAGEELQSLGFTHVYGLDGSPDMLQVA